MPLDLAINKPEDLLFGKAPKPVTGRNGLTIGNGAVYPEINFTLPTMQPDPENRQPVAQQYEEMTRKVCQRAVSLEAPGVVVEVELLPPMTLHPDWGGEIAAIVAGILNEFRDKHGLVSALRMTPVDVRENERPPKMRQGHLLEKTLRTFELCGREGADFLSIESTGGKELHDSALLNGDLAGVTLALGVLGARDMQFLWSRIGEIAKETGSISAGDTACGFANTAMVLADRGMIPRVFAAVVRVASVVRSLQAYLVGAQGPSKDCAYEGPYMKAIAGVPISMEGRTSACAHLSNVGNIAGACCDLWSNESVQNVRLLSDYAPVVSMEQLIYDCRLMNLALADGDPHARQLQTWLVESDARRDPQAWVLKPDVVVRLAAAICQEDNPLNMTLRAIDATLEELRDAVQKKYLVLSPNEARWLDMLSFQRDAIPEEEDELVATVMATIPEPLFNPEEYEIASLA